MAARPGCRRMASLAPYVCHLFTHGELASLSRLISCTKNTNKVAEEDSFFGTLLDEMSGRSLTLTDPKNCVCEC